MNLKRDPAEELKALRARIDEILNEGIIQFLQPWSDTTTPLYIYIQGYTPSFNDGEPCTHTSYEYDKNEIINDEMYEYNEEIFGNLTEEEILSSADWPTDPKFLDAIQGVHEALAFHYGTDYQVFISIKDGKVSYVRDHYDCGF